jgi:hypothetical protein
VVSAAVQWSMDVPALSTIGAQWLLACSRLLRPCVRAARRPRRYAAAAATAVADFGADDTAAVTPLPADGFEDLIGGRSNNWDGGDGHMTSLTHPTLLPLPNLLRGWYVFCSPRVWCVGGKGDGDGGGRGAGSHL